MADKKVNIVINVQGADDAKNKFNDVGGSVDKAASKVEGFSSGSTLKLAAMGVAVLAAAKAFEMLKDGIQKAAVEESAINKLNNVLKVSGSYTKDASDQLVAYANAIQHSSMFSKDEILNQLSLAKSMGYTNDQAKYLVKSATSLSTTLGKDLDFGMQTLLGTLTGVAGRIAKLSPELKTMTTEQLKAGGAVDFFVQKGINANTALGTYEGKVHQFSVAVDDLEKAFGNAIITNQTFLGWIKATAEFINGLSAKEVKLNFDMSSAKTADDKLKILYANYQQLTDAIDDPATPIEQMDKFSADLQIVSDKIDAIHKKIGVPLKGRILGDFNSEIDESIAKMSGFETAVINTSKKLSDIPVKEKAPIFTPTKTAEQKKTIKETGIAKSDYDEQLKIQADYENESAAATAAFKANENKTTFDSYNQKYTAEQTYQQQMITNEAAYQQNLLDQKLIADQANAQLIEDKYTREKTYQDNSYKYLIETEKLKTKTAKDQDKLKLEQEKTNDAKRKENMTSTLGSIATLMQSSNKELFIAGQAAAVATATIDGYAAVQKALSSAPPPFNFILAGLVGAATAMNVDKIINTQPPKYATGGIFNPTGSSISGDSNTARLNDREMVLNMQQQSNLLSMATNGGGNSAQTEILLDLRNIMASKQFSVDMDGEKMNSRLTEIKNRRLV